MILQHSFDGLTLYEGLAEHYNGPKPDFIFTNPYGYLPLALRGVAMVVHQWVHRLRDLEQFTRQRVGGLVEVARFNDHREGFYCANRFPIQLDLERFRPEPGGWYPLELAEIVLEAYTQPGDVVWDGFMGRGTIGRAARRMGRDYIGVERLPGHLALALDYLGVPKP